MTVPGSRRAQILEVAEDLFSRKGFHGTSMRDLAAALGIKAGSLYSHIKGKDELLWEIVDGIAAQFCAAAEAAAARQAPASQRLRDLMRAHLGIVGEHREMAAVLLLEWREIAEVSHLDIKARRDAHEACVARILDDGVVSGEFRPQETKWARLLVLSALNWASQWYQPGAEASPREVADRFADIILDGLATRRRRSPASSTSASSRRAKR